MNNQDQITKESKLLYQIFINSDENGFSELSNEEIRDIFDSSYTDEYIEECLNIWINLKMIEIISKNPRKLQTKNINIKFY